MKWHDRRSFVEEYIEVCSNQITYDLHPECCRGTSCVICAAAQGLEFLPRTGASGNLLRSERGCALLRECLVRTLRSRVHVPVVGVQRRRHFQVRGRGIRKMRCILNIQIPAGAILSSSYPSAPMRIIVTSDVPVRSFLPIGIIFMLLSGRACDWTSASASKA